MYLVEKDTASLITMVSSLDFESKTALKPLHIGSSVDLSYGACISASLKYSFTQAAKSHTNVLF